MSERTPNGPHQPTGSSGSVTGAGTPITATEDELFRGTVATFTDSNTSDTASTFTASIDWGDGAVTSGTVSGSSGSFTVSGDHTYADEGTFNLSVTLSYAATGSTAAVASSRASVAEGDSIIAFPAPTPISPAEGQSFTGVVARFSDTTYIDNPDNLHADFTATINWGDGTTSGGAIAPDPSLGDGGYKIIGSHTWSQDDTYTVTVSLADNAPSALSVQITSTATVGESNDFSAQGVGTLDLNEGVPFSGAVATFADTGSADSASSYAASINWGDGTAATSGTISGNAGSYSVSGNHVYADEGKFFITVTISESGTTAQIRATSTALVRETDSLTGHMILLAPVEGQNLSGPIALFSDTNLTNTASDFTALIIWGDGTRATAGTISGGNGFFIVSGSHTYSDEGTFPVSVLLRDDGGATASGTARANVTVAEADSLSGSLVSLNPTEGRSFSGAIATFSDANTANVATDFRATISWGDGSSAVGSVSGGNGAFTVSGSHTYADEGAFHVSVTLADDPPGTARGTAAGTVTVSDADSLTGSLASMRPTEGQPFSGAVATFADANLANTASDFLATIAWGDGSTSTGVVTGSSGRFTVSGSHTYPDEGSYPISVTLQDDVPGAATATASGSVSVAEGDRLTGMGTSATPIAGTSFSGAVATFSDTNRSNTAQDFVASINWGDGTTSAGTVSGSNGHFTVSGSHTYTLPGRYTVETSLRDDAPGTASASAAMTVLAAVPPSTAGSAVLAFGNTGCTAVVTSNTVNKSGSPSGTFFFRDERPGGSPCGQYRAGVVTFKSVAVDAVACTSHHTASIYGRAVTATYPSTQGHIVTFRADAAITNQTQPFNGTVKVRASNGYASGAVPAAVRIVGC